MSEEKRTNDRPEEGGTLNSGGPVAMPQETIYLQRLHLDQLTGDDMQGRREWERSGHGLPV
ncbi:hypothetical protein [Haloferula sargassicola]|uniref:Uncharacterized protein n=1 Tax=Haloferula sargassicola TaxID=490096 RepID=A0ABP9UTY9_9BACT